jgi:hypothetical protein
MPLNNYPIDVVGITVENDPSALKMAENLNDLADKPTARTNLDVYSTSASDSSASYLVNAALNNYTPTVSLPPLNPVILLNNMMAGTLYPNRPATNNGTIVAQVLTYIDFTTCIADGWVVGDRFWVATNGQNVYFQGATINGTSGHTISGYNTHICIFVEVLMGGSPSWTVT